MSTFAVNPHATAHAMWRFIYKRRCKVNGKTMPGVYGTSYENALRVVAREFGVGIEFARKRLAELKRDAEKWIRFAGRRLFAGTAEDVVRQVTDGRPSRKDMNRRARLENFTVRRESIPLAWTEFAGAKPDDPGLKRACGLM